MLIDYKKVNIYQDDVCVLKDIDFHVDEGEFIYIIGKVGSGKSSLLKTTYCELDIEEAEKAEALGRNLLELRRKDIPALRREMGIIFQSFQLLPYETALENVSLPLTYANVPLRERRERAAEVLAKVGLADRMNCATQGARITL